MSFKRNLNLKLPLSIVASWAWGTSLILGMQIAQNKGITAYVIWALFNSLALTSFSYLSLQTKFLTKKVFDNLFFKFLAVIVQLFCLLINLNILNDVAISLGFTPLASYTFATLIGLIFVLWMYPHGLRTSIWTDKWQAIITFFLLLGIVFLGFNESSFLNNVNSVATPYNLIPTTSSYYDISWALYSGLVLLASPVSDLMMYQRAEVAEKENRKYCFLTASFLFAIYMGVVLVMSFLEFTPIMNFLLLLAVIGITSSTIDSTAVALHEVGNKTIGTIIGVLVCLFWGVFNEWNVIELWNEAGALRILLALLILGTLLKFNLNRNKTNF